MRTTERGRQGQGCEGCERRKGEDRDRGVRDKNDVRGKTGTGV